MSYCTKAHSYTRVILWEVQRPVRTQGRWLSTWNSHLGSQNFACPKVRCNVSAKRDNDHPSKDSEISCTIDNFWYIFCVLASIEPQVRADPKLEQLEYSSSFLSKYSIVNGTFSEYLNVVLRVLVFRLPTEESDGFEFGLRPLTMYDLRMLQVGKLTANDLSYIGECFFEYVVFLEFLSKRECVHYCIRTSNISQIINLYHISYQVAHQEIENKRGLRDI